MTPRLYDIAQVDVGSLINMHQAGRRQRLSEIAFQREEARHQREEEQYQAGLKKQAALASLIPQVLESGSSGSAGGGTLSKMYLGSQGNNTGAAGSAVGQPAPQTSAPNSGRSTLNRSALAQLYALDPEAGKQAYELFTSMDDRQREQAKEQYDTLAAVAQSVKGLPYEQRRAALGQMVPQLQTMGISAEMVQGFDPTDTAIDGFTAQVLGVKGVLEQQNSDRTYNLDVEKFGETKKHNRVTEGISQGQLDVARGNLDARREEARKVGQPTAAQARRDEVGLRKEFHSHPDVKAFNDVRQSYRTIEAIIQNPSAANDLALIFSYMKMLDPGSVVREGEFANAQNAAGVPDQIRNAYNKARSGERLNPQQREQFLSSAGDVYRSRLGRYNELAEQYRGYASDYGADPNRVAVPEAQEKASGGSAGNGGWGKARVVNN